MDTIHRRIRKLDIKPRLCPRGYPWNSTGEVGQTSDTCPSVLRCSYRTWNRIYTVSRLIPRVQIGKTQLMKAFSDSHEDCHDDGKLWLPWPTDDAVLTFSVG